MQNEQMNRAFGDETVKLVLNTKGTKGEVSQELLDFLRYIETGIPTDDYTQELENAVNRVRRNEKWRLDYMTLYLKQQESYMDGKEEGIAEGIEKGIKKGITKGMEQKSLEIAKALLDVLDAPTVAVKTGLPVEVVQGLKEDSPDGGNP